MTQNEFKRIDHLLVLADAAQDFETVSIKLVSHLHSLREEMGLAKLLLNIKDVVETKYIGGMVSAQSQSSTATPKVKKPNQDQNVVQRVRTVVQENSGASND